MENAELVLRLRPDCGERFGIQRRAIGDHRLRPKPVVFEVSQEPQHMGRVVLPDQRAGDRIVGNRIAGQQHDSLPQMDLVDAKRAGKFREDFGAKLGSVKLPDRVFQAVVEKAGRQVQEEVTLESLLDGVDVELVAQNAIQNGLADMIIVSGLGRNIAGGRAERFAAVTLGRVLAIVNLSPEFLPIRDRANTSNPNPLATPELPTFGAVGLSRMARFSYRLSGCFLASMPDSFVLSRKKTQIEAIRRFCVYTNSNAVAISEKCL